MQNIAYNIRTLRKERGLTQEELAAQLHVTRQAVSSWERGGSCPDFDTLKRLGEVLGAAPEQLLYGAETGKPPKLQKVNYGLAIFASLLIGFCLFLVLNVIGLVIYFAILITVCTCIIVDEIRNKDYWRQLSEESITPEDAE